MTNMQQTRYTLHPMPGSFSGVTVREVLRFLNDLPAGVLDRPLLITEDPPNFLKMLTVEALPERFGEDDEPTT